jgi:4-hydroxy-tetrahydrodipicolinate reductase
MNIALIGYGKMGKVIERIAVERGHRIVAKINSSNPLSSIDLSSADMAIEFTRPNLAVPHIEYCLSKQLPIVVGTTAWEEDLDQITELVKEKNGSLLYASNFSIGVNIFFEINKRLAQLMSGQSEYKATLEEIHHLQKIDAPSGTAITLANGILEYNNDYISWVHKEEKSPQTSNHQLGVISYRKPDVPGTHTISYHSDIDSITITHEAHNRTGFALGAVVAAEWLYQRKGIYTFNDVLNF